MPVLAFPEPIQPPLFADNEMAVTAWVAGLIDGEGCILCSWSKGGARKTPHVHSQVIVRQVAKGIPMLRALSFFFGGNVLQGHAAMQSRSALFLWGLYGGNVIPFLRRIKPYLFVKAEQAGLVIELEERRRLDGILCRPRSPEFMAYAEKVVERMHELNWTGSTPRAMSDSPTNPKHGGRPMGMSKAKSSEPIRLLD